MTTTQDASRQHTPFLAAELARSREILAATRDVTAMRRFLDERGSDASDLLIIYAEMLGRVTARFTDLVNAVDIDAQVNG